MVVVVSVVVATGVLNVAAVVTAINPVVVMAVDTPLSRRIICKCSAAPIRRRTEDRIIYGDMHGAESCMDVCVRFPLLLMDVCVRFLLLLLRVCGGAMKTTHSSLGWGLPTVGCGT